MNLRSIVSWVWSAISSRFRKTLEPPVEPPAEVVEAIVEPAAAVPALPAPKPYPRRPRRQTAQFRRDVLDKLEEYQTYIRRLKRGDPRGYAMYRRVGAFILPDSDRFGAASNALEPGLVKRLPSFAAVAIGIGPQPKKDLTKKDPDDLKVAIRFAYFMKLERPDRDIERVNDGTTYRCCLYFDDEKLLPDMKNGAFGEFAINVAPNGEMRALRILRNTRQMVRYRGTSCPRGLGGNKRKGNLRPGKSQKFTGSEVVSHTTWEVPDLRDERPDTLRYFKTASDFLCWSFCMCMNLWAVGATYSMVRVTATKNGLVMPFVVPELDIPAFFKDREKTGRRIFHVVGAQKPRKNSKTGEGIRLHFRGEKDFKWNGYQINITVPGKFALDLADVTIGAIEGEDIVAGTRMVEMEEFTDLVADHIAGNVQVEGRAG